MIQQLNSKEVFLLIQTMDLDLLLMIRKSLELRYYTIMVEVVFLCYKIVFGLLLQDVKLKMHGLQDMVR